MFIINFKRMKDHNKREILKKRQIETEKKMKILKSQEKAIEDKKDLIILKKLNSENKIKLIKKQNQTTLPRVPEIEENKKKSYQDNNLEITSFEYTIDKTASNTIDIVIKVSKSVNFDLKDKKNSNIPMTDAKNESKNKDSIRNV